MRTDRRPEARCAALQLPASRIVDDSYYAKILPTLDRQLGLARLRLARFLYAAEAAGKCGPDEPRLLHLQRWSHHLAPDTNVTVRSC